MTVCEQCGQPDEEALSCLDCVMIVLADGRSVPPVRFGDESRRVGERCECCGVERGGVHHFECHVEECPNCGGPLVLCGCTALPDWVRRTWRWRRIRRWLFPASDVTKGG